MNAIHDEARQGGAPADEAQAPWQGPAPGAPAGAPRSAAYSAPALDVNDPRRKNPALAGILSAMPGLGQVYVGYYPRGFAHILVVGSVIALVNSGSLHSLEPLAGLFLAFFWLYNILDAVRRASLYNQYLAGGREVTLHDDFRLPSMGGSIFGGVALLAGGGLLLLHTRFGLSLDFVEDWWPLLPMGFGAFLLLRAVQDRSRQIGGDRARSD